MIEKKRPKAIVLDSNDVVRLSASLILQKQGWDVTCEEVSAEALATLQNTKNKPYALFITNFRLPKMEGDDILEQVKKISPLTQRMLMISDTEPEILISAINRAVVDSCISAPFREEDLIEQSRACFSNFKREVKRRRLKRITTHQNQQLLTVARKLKKRGKSFKDEIDEKKRQILKLKSRKREILKKKELTTDVSIDAYMGQKKVEMASESFLKEFSQLSRSIQKIFNTVTQKENLSPVDLNMELIFTPPETAGTPDAENEDNDTDTQAEQAVEPTENSNATPEEAKKPASLDDDLLEQIIRYVLSRQLITQAKMREQDAAPFTQEGAFEENGNPLDNYLELEVNELQTQALVGKKEGYNPELAPAIAKVHAWLTEKSISYGIIEDALIEKWLKSTSKEKIVIAAGIAPVFGTPGSVTYHFESDFTNPGKINEDGTIDFRDRGDIPFVKKGTLLAQITPAKQGTAGMGISGFSLPVEEVEEAVMTPGPGTDPAEDGLSISAQIDGQPHVDAMGTVSVSPDLVIRGDVDYQTGNIKFNGNIVVSGMIKEGFSVNGINLTVQEIEGGRIELSGDLNVSAGITEAEIMTHGNIRAKFINNSKVTGFGDLYITKEIIDSQIMISGACKNETGHIISSHVCAKLGIEAGNIGTPTSTPSVLKVGVDEFVINRKKELNEKLENSLNQAEIIKGEIRKLEEEDQALYEKVSEKAHIQDRSQVEIRKIEDGLPEIQKSNDRLKLKKAADQIKALTAKAKQAEDDLNAVFETQDDIAGRINALKEQISMLEELNKKLVLEKNAIKKFSQKTEPVPSVSISRTITQDTSVKGMHSSIIVREDRSKCRISEIKTGADGMNYYELVFTDL